MLITFYQRRPHEGYFSIERYFADLRKAIPGNIKVKVAVSRYPSRGFWGRVYNVIEAAFRQGDVNHITGDVHYLTLLLQKKRTILTVHDLGSVNRLKGIRRALFILFWFRLPIKRAAVVTVVSEATREDLFYNFKVNPKKVRVVYVCLSEDYRRWPKEFNASKPVILQIGTGQNKNVERVAEALGQIPCQLRIIGMLNAKQQAICQRYGVDYSAEANISNEQMVEEYRRCDMLIFASTYEGFGMPIIEAQAIGRPVVSSKVWSMPEVAAAAAHFVDPFDRESIREGILKVINDPTYRNELVRRGFENVERFRSHKIAQDYIDIYKELLARKSSTKKR